MGSSLKGGKAPKAPDYAAAARETSDMTQSIARDATYADRPNQYNPWGSTEWDVESVTDPTTGRATNRWNQRTSLDPELQRSLDLQQNVQTGRSELAHGLLGRAGAEFGPLSDWNKNGMLSRAPKAPTYSTAGMQSVGPRDARTNLDFSGAYKVGDPTEIRNKAEAEIYKRQQSRLDPVWDQRVKQTEIELKNQGLVPGTEAYNDAMNATQRGRNDAYQTAMSESIIGGGAESDRMLNQMMARREMDVGETTAASEFYNRGNAQLFDQEGKTRENQFSEMMRGNEAEWQQGKEGAGFNNQVRQQEISEELQRRGFSLNEINALLDGGQVQMPQNPSFQTASSGQAPDLMGALNGTYNGMLNKYGVGQANAASNRQALAGIITAIASASDVRLKENIRVLVKGKKYNIYTWDWNRLAHMLGIHRDPNVGVIAQEVMKVVPEAVVKLFGIYHVDYAMLESINANG